MANTKRSLPKPDRLFIGTIGRAFRLLEGFSDGGGPLTLPELAAAAGIDKSAAQRAAHTLERLGYVEYSGGGLVPGRRLLERSLDYLRANPIVARAMPVLAELRRSVQERVDLSLFDGTSMLYLIRMQSKRDTFFGHLVGRRVPTYCTSGGRAALSALSEDDVRHVLDQCDLRKLTPRTTIDIQQILECVTQARQNGYALAVEETHIGELAVGSAVLDRQGRPIAAIHVGASLSDWEPDQFERKIAPLVVAAARAVGELHK